MMLQAKQIVFRDLPFSGPGSSFSQILVLLLILFFFGMLLEFLWLYFQRLKREDLLKVFLGYENLWNSVPMQEARRNAPARIDQNLLGPSHKDGLRALDHARMILDFFNHLGIQVYQGIIRFRDVFLLYGREILQYWEKKDYRLLVRENDTTAGAPFLRPWIGLEYLVQLCQEQDEIDQRRLRDRTSLTYRDSLFQQSKGLTFGLVLLCLFAVLSLVLVAFSFYYYYHCL